MIRKPVEIRDFGDNMSFSRTIGSDGVFKVPPLVKSIIMKTCGRYGTLWINLQQIDNEGSVVPIQAKDVLAVWSSDRAKVIDRVTLNREFLIKVVKVAPRMRGEIV